MTTTGPTPGLRDRVVAAPAALRTRVLVDFIVDQLKQALGVEEGDPDEIHARSRFEELGVDSKRALEFKEYLEQEFGGVLPTTLMFDYPTPEALAAYLVNEVLGLGAPAVAAAAAPAPPPAPANVATDGDGDIEERLRRKLEQYQL